MAQTPVEFIISYMEELLPRDIKNRALQMEEEMMNQRKSIITEEQKKRLTASLLRNDEKDGLYEPVTNNHTLTAIEWLLKNIHVVPKFELSAQDIIKQAKKMEEQQIIDAWMAGDNDGSLEPKAMEQIAKQYYNQTYKK